MRKPKGGPRNAVRRAPITHELARLLAEHVDQFGIGPMAACSPPITAVSIGPSTLWQVLRVSMPNWLAGWLPPTARHRLTDAGRPDEAIWFTVGSLCAPGQRHVRAAAELLGRQRAVLGAALFAAQLAGYLESDAIDYLINVDPGG
jgi:hypothetical protein